MTSNTNNRNSRTRNRRFTLIVKGIVQIIICAIIVSGIVHIVNLFRPDKTTEYHEKMLSAMQAEIDVHDAVNRRKILVGQIYSCIYMTIERAGSIDQRVFLDRDREIYLPLSDGEATEEELNVAISTVKQRFSDINWDDLNDLLNRLTEADAKIAEAESKYNDILYELSRLK